jgi:hypothetical protein
MKRISATSALLIPLLVIVCGRPALSQQDRELRNKQVEFKKEFSDSEEKNQLIRSAADDKPRPTTGRTRRSVTTGYDYTQVKGYTLHNFDSRIDQLFEEKYQPDGTFPVPGRKGMGSSQIRKVEVYYVETTPEEQENTDANPFEIIEVRVEKLETLPPAEVTEDQGGETGGLLGFGGGNFENVAKGYSLSGNDLVNLIHLSDESLYEDMLARRSQEQPIPLPADLFLPEKRGPFIVQTDRDLETTIGRFSDFWNPKDTLASIILPPTNPASGPLTSRAVPVFYPDEQKISIRNPNPTQLKITTATFVGKNANDFVLHTKLPVLLAPKNEQNDRVDLAFEYVGTSPYETPVQLMVEAKESNLSQGIDIVANPGMFPSDVFVLDASFNRIELRSPTRSSFAPDWKISYDIGNDEVGLPRWSTGISSLSVGYKHDMSVGVVFPMNMLAASLPSPLRFDKGLLTSSVGYNVNFDFTFGFPFSLGGNLTVVNKFSADEASGHLRTIENAPVLPGEPDYNHDFFHISTIAQAYYPIMFKDRTENPNVAFRINIGGTFMQVQRDHVVQPGESEKEGVQFSAKDVGTVYTLGREKDLVDVYFRIAFINLGAKNTYGLGLQYFSGRVMTDAWLELTDWFRVEAAYSFLLRDRYIWENESTYFMLTPRIRLGFPSIFD